MDTMKIYKPFFILFCVLKCVHFQTVPHNPCPNVFQYVKTNGIIHGRVEFTNDRSGQYYFAINMSVAAYLGDQKDLQLQLLTSSQNVADGQPLTYNIYFPVRNIILKPTKIVFNNKIYCSAPPAKLEPGGYVTNVWAESFLKIDRYVTYTQSQPTYGQSPNIQSFGPSISNEQVFAPRPIDFSPSNNQHFPLNKPISNRPNVGEDDYFNPPQPSFFPENFRPIRPNRTNEQFPSPNRPIFPNEYSPIQPNPATERFPSNRPVFSNEKSPIQPNPTIEQLPPTNTQQVSPNRPGPHRPIDHKECGVSNLRVQPLVVGGDEVSEGQFPWMTAIMCKIGNEYQYRCTGTLVSNRHVITAGHCFQYGNKPFYNPEDIVVVLGVTSLEDWDKYGTVSKVKSFVVNPDYKGNSADSDISIITLSQPVQFREDIRRACLWDEGDDLNAIVSLEGNVAGWGADNPNGEFSQYARSINLPIVSNDVCLESDPEFGSYLSSRTFCAGRRDKTGPCTGDSGAGFLMYRKGRWTLRGVTSIALKDTATCDLENYSIFADIAKARRWVRNTLATDD